LATSENDDVILTADQSATAGDDGLGSLLALVEVDKVRTECLTLVQRDEQGQATLTPTVDLPGPQRRVGAGRRHTRSEVTPP